MDVTLSEYIVWMFSHIVIFFLGIGGNADVNRQVLVRL